MDAGTGLRSHDAFTLKYHDTPDVLDFFVLKQTHDTATERRWTVGDRMRCIIDDAWWLGTVVSKEPYSDDHPTSDFLCYSVIWDNKEEERLSPWDMEPVDHKRPLESGCHVTAAEWTLLRYAWTSEDWGEGACREVSRLLGAVMELAVAEPFLVPVDLSRYPNYACVVEYPMDLSTIKARLDNGFYRRLNACQFDVRYIATNAER